MAQVDIQHPAILGAVYVLQETTFGAGTPTQRAWPIQDTLDFACDAAELDRKTLAVDPNDYRDPVSGLHSATCKFGYYLQPSAEVLDASVSTTPTDTPLAMLMHALIGGESTAGGSAVEASPAPAAGGFSVGAGKGAGMLAGQILLVKDPNGGLLPARVLARSTDALTIWPSLSAAPATAAKVVNTFTWYPSRANTQSLAVAIAAAQETHPESFQWLLSGGTGTLALKFERAGLATADFDLKFAAYTGPEDYGFTYATSADTMAAPLSARNAVSYLQTPATTTRTTYPIDSVAVKLNLGNVHTESLTGGTESTRGVVRAGNLDQAACELDIVFAGDVVADTTWWSNRTGLSFMLYLPTGASGSERMIVLDVPLAVVVGKPKQTKGASGLIKTAITLRAKRDTSCTGTTDLATAPFRLAIG